MTRDPELAKLLVEELQKQLTTLVGPDLKAIERAIHELNQKRTAENTGNKLENRARLSAGLVPRLDLPARQVGCRRP